MNSAFAHNYILPFAFIVFLIATLALLFARRHTKNVSPTTGSVRWLIQILLLVALFVTMIILSNYAHNHHIRVSN